MHGRARDMAGCGARGKIETEIAKQNMISAILILQNRTSFPSLSSLSFRAHKNKKLVDLLMSELGESTGS